MILVRVHGRSRTNLRARHWSRSCDSWSRGLNCNFPWHPVRSAHRAVAGDVPSSVRRLAHAFNSSAAVHPLRLRRRQLRRDGRRAAPLVLIQENRLKADGRARKTRPTDLRLLAISARRGKRPLACSSGISQCLAAKAVGVSSRFVPRGLATTAWTFVNRLNAQTERVAKTTTCAT